jgi:hypothetical protein
MSGPGNEHADLLLLNASNFPGNVIFPYAFVQVSAVARRYGVRVKRFDFLGLDPGRVRPVLAELLERHQPRMVGLHLRQADSVVESDYAPPPTGNPGKYYLPVDDTKALIGQVRELTGAPVVVGGFGFTMHVRHLAPQLRPDFGITGEPDGFFERFEDVLGRRRLEQVPNLVYRRGRSLAINERVYFDPSPEPEYDDEIIDELFRFYGHNQLVGAAPPSVAVEIARGCPYRCYFCTEPPVKGRAVRYRPWDVVEEDIRRLDARQIRHLWLICSELNIHRGFAMQVAARMQALNDGRPPERRLRWRAYNLPRLPPQELDTLVASGFSPGWNDFPSIDEKNLRDSRVPYRVDDVVKFYGSFLDLMARDPPPEGIPFTLFLGNAHADPRTIRTTLQKIDELGWAERHADAHVAPATRVFEVGGELIAGDRKSSYSVGRSGRIRLNLAAPTFHFPPALVRHLGTEEAVREFFRYIEGTFLSVAHRTKKDWAAFLGTHLTPARLAEIIAAAKRSRTPEEIPISDDDPDTVRFIEETARGLWAHADAGQLRRLFYPGEDRARMHVVAQVLLYWVLAPRARKFTRVLDHLGIPHDRQGFVELSDYRLAEILYRRYPSNEAVVADVINEFALPEGSVDVLQLHYLLFNSHIVIRPAWRDLLFERPAKRGRARSSG